MHFASPSLCPCWQKVGQRMVGRRLAGGWQEGDRGWFKALLLAALDGKEAGTQLPFIV